ncbi:YicC/YloC family endoribonuclease [Luteolibacter pohnpeiensis]|nr:YicC/YloC family endoribonuclease [Luteolibacter pohnpeiensis]
MTGFGRGSASTTLWHANVEITTVNRKQAEVVIQAPRELNELDARIRKQILAVLSRGRIQVSINLENTTSEATEIELNSQLAQSLEAAFTELGNRLGRPLLPTASDLLRQPDFILTRKSGMDPEACWGAIEPALEEALQNLAAMRAREGEDLKADLLTRLSELIRLAEKIAAEAPARPARQLEVLQKRLRDANLELNLDDERLLKELAIYADRCDITEELTRLDSHFAKFKEYLDAPEPPGRPLDFLCQELFREFNTIASKANDAQIAQSVVEAKTELEKIREQVQNVE